MEVKIEQDNEALQAIKNKEIIREVNRYKKNKA